VKARGIAYHEKTLGQLFCDNSARDIIDMLTDDMRDAGVRLELSTEILEVSRQIMGFEIRTSQGTWQTRQAGGCHRRQIDPQDGRHRSGL
jgi:predicted flavoprotein YhiN